MELYYKSKLIEAGVDVNRSVKEYFFENLSNFMDVVKNYPTDINLFKEIYAAIEDNDSVKAFEIAYQLQIQLGFLCFDVVYNKVIKALDKFRKGTVFGTKKYFDQVYNRYNDFIEIVKEMKGENKHE